MNIITRRQILYERNMVNYGYGTFYCYLKLCFSAMYVLHVYAVDANDSLSARM